MDGSGAKQGKAAVEWAKRGPAWLIVLLCTVAMLSLALSLEGNTGSPRTFYESCLDRRIALCRIAFEGGGPEDLENHAVRKARFYEERRESLIAQMEEQNIGIDPQAIEYFLQKVYIDHVWREVDPEKFPQVD